jgi:hypothetical protein
MSSVFILRNQQGLFTNRQGEWVNGREASGLFRTAHKDEAINEMFEISAKDPQQRIEIVSVEANSKGIPTIPDDWIVQLPEAQMALTEALNDDAEPSTTDEAHTDTTEQSAQCLDTA